ncbi:GNAT family N-acetyltransferase [Psychromarinibacter halotolerans]|uniref:GNAT family N-acetyltransferase n=1 Tax=Psychromarinibacter halotolerans TaxID=1775175 RepID=A0ABV7GUR2_9RHOB|nr:GNAT family N-acetyltransferase [Psychromarinibacter halotolerans]MAQ84836.1 GNAT family N-acetyltransferase [Maritimibacter sp.]MDF0596121.1 GNAT family N-acetyltransferase [Psychromarinibacter halotolerans]
MTGTTLHIPTLETQRLVLRAPRWQDFEAYAAFRGDAERTAFLGGPFTRNTAFSQMAEIVGHWQLRGFGRFLVADRHTDEPLGIVGPYYPEGWPEPELAWSVFANAEGRGVAFEAVSAARRWAYETLGWTTAISLIATSNLRSARLAERLGAKNTGQPFGDPDSGKPVEIWRHPVELPADEVAA